MTRYLVLLIGLPGCGSPDRATPDFSQDSTARQAATQTVSSAAVDAVVALNRPAIVLVEKDRVIWVGDSAGPAMAQAAWADFVREARIPGVVPALLTRDVESIRVSRWQLRGEVTDTAVIALSGIGFSPSGDEAVLLVDYRCGTRCGVGMIWTLQRRGESWDVTKSDTVYRNGPRGREPVRMRQQR